MIDKESGKDLDRKGYQSLKNTMLRRGDTLIVKSLDRLSRNKCDIKKELEYFKEHGIRLKGIPLRIVGLAVIIYRLFNGNNKCTHFYIHCKAYSIKRF